MSDVVKALIGRRVVVTRAADQAAGLTRTLERLGADVIACPTIRTEPPASYGALDSALRRAGEYRWVVFTSASGVAATVARLEALGRRETLGATQVAAVGPATRATLEASGVRVAFVPDDFTAEHLGRTLDPVEGERVLLLRADIARPALPQALESRGALVDDVVAYRTVARSPTPEAIAELKVGVDAVTFTSASTVRGFVEMGPGWRDLIGGVIIATIGPQTTAAAEEAGLDVHVEAAEHTTEGLVTALVDRLQQEARR